MNISECILCEKKYDVYLQLGLMDCMIHPLHLNRKYIGGNHIYPLGHYECCGASTDCSIHCEASNPKGCHRIDHVSSQKELESILEKPFICIMIGKFDINRQKAEQVVTISENFYSKYNYYNLKMPFNKQYSINLKEEYNSLLKTENCKSSSIEITESSQQYYIYSKEEQLQQQNQNQNCIIEFYPFYIIRRMDFKIDNEKKKEIKSYYSCF